MGSTLETAGGMLGSAVVKFFDKLYDLWKIWQIFNYLYQNDV